MFCEAVDLAWDVVKVTGSSHSLAISNKEPLSLHTDPYLVILTALVCLGTRNPAKDVNSKTLAAFPMSALQPFNYLGKS